MSTAMDIPMKDGVTRSSAIDARASSIQIALKPCGRRRHRRGRLLGFRRRGGLQSLQRCTRQGGKANSCRDDLAEHAFKSERWLPKEIVADTGGLDVLVKSSAGLSDPQAVQGHDAREASAVGSMSVVISTVRVLSAPAASHLEQSGRDRPDAVTVVGELPRASARVGLAIISAARAPRHRVDRNALARGIGRA